MRTGLLLAGVVFAFGVQANTLDEVLAGSYQLGRMDYCLSQTGSRQWTLSVGMQKIAVQHFAEELLMSGMDNSALLAGMGVQYKKGKESASRSLCGPEGSLKEQWFIDYLGRNPQTRDFYLGAIEPLAR